MAENSDAILSLAAQIVSAHVAHNSIEADALPKLINDVHHALAHAQEVITTLPKPDPAVDVKKSVRADKIVCLDCGKSFSMIKRHLTTDHIDAYRVSPEVGTASILPDGGAELCQSPFVAREEDWPRA